MNDDFEELILPSFELGIAIQILNQINQNYDVILELKESNDKNLKKFLNLRLHNENDEQAKELIELFDKSMILLKKEAKIINDLKKGHQKIVNNILETLEEDDIIQKKALYFDWKL